jgi:hypothetical protein
MTLLAEAEHGHLIGNPEDSIFTFESERNGAHAHQARLKIGKELGGAGSAVGSIISAGAISSHGQGSR